MKKSIADLENELKEVNDEWWSLNAKYPLYIRVDGHLTPNPVPEEIWMRYQYLHSRERNIKNNINQVRMRELNGK